MAKLLRNKKIEWKNSTKQTSIQFMYVTLIAPIQFILFIEFLSKLHWSDMKNSLLQLLIVCVIRRVLTYFIEHMWQLGKIMLFLYEKADSHLGDFNRKRNKIDVKSLKFTLNRCDKIKIKSKSHIVRSAWNKMHLCASVCQQQTHILEFMLQLFVLVS